VRAVIPAAGFGTRFLPATKAIPKEMLPVCGKPAIQWVVEEAWDAGIREVVFVVSRGKACLEDHFCPSPELEGFLRERGKLDLVERLRAIPPVRVISVRQHLPLGLGHAVWCAREAVGGEPFCVLLPDDLVCADSRPCIGQLLEVYRREGLPVVALRRVPRQETRLYGVVEAEPLGGGLHRIRSVVEKPSPEEAPSELAIVGRYVLIPRVFEVLERTPPSGGEIQLTDALRELASDPGLLGYEFQGERYDVGHPLGFMEANLLFTLRDPELGAEARRILRRIS